MNRALLVAVFFGFMAIFTFDANADERSDKLANEYVAQNPLRMGYVDGIVTGYKKLHQYMYISKTGDYVGQCNIGDVVEFSNKAVNSYLNDPDRKTLEVSILTTVMAECFAQTGWTFTDFIEKPDIKMSKIKS